MFLKLLLYSSLIFVIETVSPTNQEIKNVTGSQNKILLRDVLESIIPIHYDVYITLNIFKNEIKTFSGKCIAEIKIKQPINRISFHAQQPQLEVENCIWINQVDSSAYVTLKGTYELYQDEDQLLVFKFREQIPIGHYLLVINFDGSLDDDGGFFKVSIKNDMKEKTRMLIATQTFGARQLFPCWDEPSLRTTFKMIITYPDKYKIISIMPIHGTIKVENNIESIHFKTTPAITTYHVGFIMHDLYYISGGNLLANVWCRHQLNNEIGFVREIIKIIIIYSKHLKISKDDLNTHHVIIPGFKYNDIEKWNLIFYKESAVTYNSKVDSETRKIEVTRLVARKMVHRRLNNLINPFWSHFWLNKGVAMLLGTNVIDLSFLDFRMMDLFVIQLQQESLRLDTHSITGSVTLNNLQQTVDTNIFSNWQSFSENNLHISFFSYYKAPAILRMLQHILTHEIFQHGIEKFYNMPIESKTIDNFWNALQVAYDLFDAPNLYKLNIKNLMDSWINMDHYPILTIEETLENVTIYVENIYPTKLNESLSILVTATKETTMNFTISMDRYKHFVKWISHQNPSTYEFPHKSEEWIIFNLQQIGYYRVWYSIRNWQNIASYLNYTAQYTNIHVLNRAQIIDDAYYFLKTGRMDLSLFLNITEYLWHETDYVAWYPMFKALEDMSTIFLFPNKNYIKVKVLKYLQGVLHHITYDDLPNDTDLTKCLRYEAAKWMCALGAFECRKVAEIKFRDYVADRTKNFILPTWKQWTYCNYIAERDIIGDVLYVYIATLDKKIFKYFACSQNSDVIKDLLLIFNKQSKYLEDHPLKLQDHDHINYFHNIIEKHARDNMVLDFILKNWKDVKPNHFNVIAALIDIINHVYSEEQLNMIKQNVKHILNNIESTDQNKHAIYLELLIKGIPTAIDTTVALIDKKIHMRSSQIKYQMKRFDNK